MPATNQSVITCAACGKQLPWQESCAGRQVKCPCGQMILVPSREPALDEGADDGEYDFAEPLPQPKPGLRAAGISPDVVLARIGMIPVPKPAGPDPDARASAQAMEKMLAFSPLFDLTIPAILMVVGLVLGFIEVMYADGHGRAPVLGTAVLVIARAALSTALMLGGIFLATAAFDVCIIGSFRRSMFKLAAVAIAPSAVYGLLCYAIGDVGGSTAGTLAAVALYGILFYWLLKLDLKDTAVCVVITWILITAVNYAAYKFQGAARGTWI